MKLNFTKMHGAGNDFVVLDAFSTPLQVDADLIRKLSHRHFGVGADQILLVEAPLDPSADFRYRIFNADGGEVEQCGNGARCFARFVHDKGLTRKKTIRVETQAGMITPTIQEDGRVTVDMGPPRLTPAEVPFESEGLDTRTLHEGTEYRLPVPADLNNGTDHVWVSVVSMGNPHAVIRVESVARAPVAALGKYIEVHPRFPARVNVGFLQVDERDSVRLRVFERGAGETLACGTGACAAAVAGMRLGLLDPVVDVMKRGGQLTIDWKGQGHPVLMTGPAQTVFEGVIQL